LVNSIDLISRTKAYNAIFYFLGGGIHGEFYSVMLVNKHLNKVLQSNDEFRLWKCLLVERRYAPLELPSMQFLTSERGDRILRYYGFVTKVSRLLLNVEEEYSEQCLHILKYFDFELSDAAKSRNRQVKELGLKLKELQGLLSKKCYGDFTWIYTVEQLMPYLINSEFNSLYNLVDEIARNPTTFQQFLSQDMFVIIYTYRALRVDSMVLPSAEEKLLSDRKFALRIITHTRRIQERSIDKII
jgi:hypothetical protein